MFLVNVFIAADAYLLQLQKYDMPPTSSAALSSVGGAASTKPLQSPIKAQGKQFT